MAAPLPESDGDLVRLALEGRQDAFSALYERYFPSVFDFVTRLLRNREEAADVAQDAFIKAMEQLPTLKNPDRFKSWIFTIAHRTGLNRIRSSKRTATVGGSVDDDERATMAVADADPSVDPEQMAAIQEAADIIWEAAAGLDARTYAVMDLHVRHGLDSAEIAEVMGVSKGNAYTMVSRMKQSFSKTLSTYLLVRKGRADCSTLASVIGPDTEQMTPDLRKRADRHVNRCDVCSDNRLFYMEPLKMFAALMLVPVPAGLKAAIWGSVAASAAGAAGVGTVVASGSGAGAAAGGGAGTSGAGAAAGGVAAGAQAGTIAAAVAAVALTVAVAAGAFALFNRTDDPPPAAAPFPTTTTTTVIVEPVTPATPPPTTTITATPPPTTTITATPPPTTTVAPVGEPPPPPPTPTTLPPPPPPPDFDVANDTGTLAEDTTIAINVLANDVGPIDAASLRVVSGPTNGSAATNADGAILYTPAANFVGADQISYSVADTLGRSAAATVSLAVTPINDNPVVPGPGSVVTAEDITISFDPLDGASDVDGDVLTMTSFDTTSAAGGSLAEGSLVYTPPPNFFGTDSFTYTVSDGTVDVLVSVQVTVDPVADPPAAPADPPAFEVPEDGSGSIDLLAGWTDPDGDALTAIPGTITSTNGGAVVIEADGIATYTAPPNFSGVDTFDFVVTDGALETNSTAIVTVTSANDAPVVEDATFETPEDSAIGTLLGTIVASDPDGDAVTFTPVSGPIAIDAAGVVTVGELLDFELVAVHMATTTVSDGNGGEASATVTLSVANVNEPPVAQDATFEISEDAAVGTVLGTIVVTDPDGDPVTFTPVSGPIAIDAAGVVTVGEPLDFDDQQVHTATTSVSDDNFGEAEVTVTLNVLQGNQAPSLGDGLVVVPDTATPGTVIATLVGTDPDLDELTYAIVGGDPEGVFTIGETSGELVYANDPVALPLPTSLTVTVIDPDGLSDSATITIVVLDTTDPTISDLQSDPGAIFAGTAPDLVCTVGQPVAVLTATVEDEGGVRSVEFNYVGDIAGTIFSGSLPGAAAGSVYSADFAVFVPEDIGQWSRSRFAITVTATDIAGNVSTLGGETVLVRDCPQAR